MFKLYITIISCFSSAVLFSQSFIKNGSVSEILQYELPGYSIIDTCVGDLNRDNFPDLIVVYGKTSENETSDVIDNPELRPLAIYTGKADRAMNFTTSSDRAVLCVDCGGVMGDPFTGIVIKNGYFTVEHYGGSAWRWTRYITFKYAAKSGDWNLHRDGGDFFHSADPENTNKHSMKTVKDFGIVPFEEYDIYNNEEL